MYYKVEGFAGGFVPQPLGLVLSDLVVTEIELANRIMFEDPRVTVVFVSKQRQYGGPYFYEYQIWKNPLPLTTNA